LTSTTQNFLQEQDYKLKKDFELEERSDEKEEEKEEE
jgi:hypothetical protein